MTKKYYSVSLTSNFLIYTTTSYVEIDSNNSLYDMIRNLARQWINQWLYNEQGIPKTTRIELSMYSGEDNRGDISLVVNDSPGYVHIGCYNCSEITREDYIEGLLL